MFLIALICLLLSSACARADEVPAANAPVDLIELFAGTNAKVEQFQFSPDGGRIAYVSAKNGSFDIWVMNSDGTNAHPVTDAYPEAEADPQWSPDGQWIAYNTRHCGTGCWSEIFMVRPDDAAPPVNLTFGRGGGTPKWTPDGKLIVFVRGGDNGFAQVATTPAEIPRGRVGLKFLTNSPFSNSDPQVSPDGKWIAFTSDRSGKLDQQRMDIWVMPSSGGSERLLTPGMLESYESNPQWSPDSKKIAFVSNKTGWRNIGVIDVGSGEIKMLTNSPWDEANPKWSPDGKSIVFVANKKWNFYLMKVPAAGGSVQQLTEREGVNGGFEGTNVRGTFRWSPDSRSIAYTYMGPDTCSDIWIMPADGGTPLRLTNHMPAGLAEHPFVKPELITYKGKDGLDVAAFLYMPLKIDPNRKPPLILYAHSFGGTGMYVNGFYPFVQYFVSRGYAVLGAEVRGSAGNGRDWANKNYGDWGGGDIDDTAAGAQHLIAQGLVDPKRIVMQGGSTGGYRTMQTIVRYPDLLQAAVNFYGPTNLVSLYDFYPPSRKPILMDTVGGQRGDPSRAPEHWRERSATFNVDRVKTPLLMLFADRDGGVPSSQADEYYQLSRQRGKPADYVLYYNESHGWYTWRPETLKDALRRVAAHYEKHVGQ